MNLLARWACKRYRWRCEWTFLNTIMQWIVAPVAAFVWLLFNKAQAEKQAKAAYAAGYKDKGSK